MSPARLDILLVSTADWDNPYWTNKQHVAVHLARIGHRILYVESQGLRTPTATSRDLKRIWARLKRGLLPPRLVQPNVWVWSPIVIPLQSKTYVRRINRYLLNAGIALWRRRIGLNPKVLWTYSPLTTELYAPEDFSLVVYHAVDDIKAQPGMPQEAIEHAENTLAARADLIFTTSHRLQETHRRVNPQTYYFSNVADYEHFNSALSPATLIPADLSALKAPRIGFIGAISSYKLNFGMIRWLADRHPEWSFVFIGEIGEGDPRTDPSMLTNAANIHLLGGKPYKELPSYLKGMDVVMQPNLINNYTKSMFPMKFFEYLAAGKRIVSTQLPALADYHHVASFCNDDAAFEHAIEQALINEGPSLEARLAAARQQTYDIRTLKMMSLVDDALLAKRECSGKPTPEYPNALK